MQRFNVNIYRMKAECRYQDKYLPRFSRMKCLHKKCSLDDTLNMLFEIYGCWMLRFISLDKGSQTSRVRQPAIITHGGLYSRMFQGTVWWMPLHCVGVRWTQETAHPPCCSLDTRCWPAHPLYSCHAAAPREEDTIPAQQHSVYFNPILLQEIMKSVCFSVICAYLTEWWRNDECRSWTRVSRV